MTLTKGPISVKGKRGFQKRTVAISDGEQDIATEETIVELEFDIDPDRVYVFETLKKSAVPRVENLGSRCKVFDPIQKRYRELRYVPVAPSIYLEEQHESYDSYPDEPLSFYRNQIQVKGSDVRKMEYMLTHELCENSPYRFSGKPAMFKLMDKDVEDKIRATRHAKEQEAYKAVSELPMDDLRPIARVVFGVTETSDVAIKNAMYDLIKIEKKGSEQKSNAEKVIENLINPRLLRRYNIQVAMDRGIIIADTNKMQVRLNDTGVILYNITTAKNTDTIVNELANYSFTADGNKMYDTIKNKLHI